MAFHVCHVGKTEVSLDMVIEVMDMAEKQFDC
jgi:hypothetical protein